MAESKIDAPFSGSHRFVAPPRHRLFAIFDDPVVGRQAVEELRSEGYGEDQDIWVFFGEEGRLLLDAAGRSLGLGGRILRVIERAMTNDFGYLQTLDDALQRGSMVIAVRTPDEESADLLARRLRSSSAHSFAYGAHFDFVPIAA